MIEVGVRDDEGAVRPQESCRFGERFILVVAEVLEEPLGDDDVEPPVVEGDRSLEDIDFTQVRGRSVNRDVDPMVADRRSEKLGQGCRSAADVEEVALLRPCDPIDKPRHLLEPKVRLNVLERLAAPEVLLVIAHAIDAAHGRDLPVHSIA